MCKESTAQPLDTQEARCNPNSNGIGVSKENNGMVNIEQKTAYLKQVGTTIQSNKEIPIQYVATGNPLMGRLWSQQVEEESEEEGELHSEYDQDKEEDNGQVSDHKSDEGVLFEGDDEEDDVDKNEEACKNIELKAPELDPKPTDRKMIQSKVNPNPTVTLVVTPDMNPNTTVQTPATVNPNPNTDLQGNKVPVNKVLNEEKENTSKAVVPKPVKTQLTKQTAALEEEDNVEGKGKDMDEESITHNFRKVARQGDLSPRHLDKAKSTGKDRKKQQKEISIVSNIGVQTRRTLSKSTN